MEPISCSGCGVELYRTGFRGRPRKLCEDCREKVYASAVCFLCGEPLPAIRRSDKIYCSSRCGNTAWVAVHRADLKAELEQLERETVSREATAQ